MLNTLQRSYRAWRVFDNSLIILHHKIPCEHKISIAPADLVTVFGPQGYFDKIPGTTGTYEFEDTNLDVFRIFDRHHTREFIKPRLLKLKHPPYSHRGKSENLPTAEEFWKSSTPVDFWVGSTEYADVQSFTKWLKEKLEKKEDIYKKLIEKYGEIDSGNNYKKNYELSRDYALFKYNKIKWD